MSPTVHATALIVGETGLLLRGPSGAGKSATALMLIDLAESRGLFARLVADDRVRLYGEGGRLIAAPHPAIAGRVERRGAGIETTPHLDRAVIALVVDLDPAAPRLPQRIDATEELCGVRLPRLTFPADPRLAGAAIFARLRAGAASG